MTTENVGPPESLISDLQLDVGPTLLVVKPCFHPFIHSAVFYVPWMKSLGGWKYGRFWGCSLVSNTVYGTCRLRCADRCFWARGTETMSHEPGSPSGRSWRPSRGLRTLEDAGNCSSSSTRRNRRLAHFTSGRCYCMALVSHRTSDRR